MVTKVRSTFPLCADVYEKIKMCQSTSMNLQAFGRYLVFRDVNVRHRGNFVVSEAFDYIRIKICIKTVV